MPRRRTLIGAVTLLTALAAAEPPTVNTVVPLVPTEYRHRLVQQLSLAEDNQQTWLDALAAAPADHRPDLAYLLVNMPEGDLKTLHGDRLLAEIALAHQARAATPWAAAVPEELFRRYVLPYAALDEKRDPWRPAYAAQFAPLVKNCKSATEAAQLLNKQLFPAMKVKYHATKRQKPNQSPAESAALGYASCTGLSIMLVDACRSVGIPARVVGTPLWADKSGNHTWTEFWDGQWYFVGAAEPGPLNQTWFAANAAQADDAKPEHRIYAATFEQTDAPPFPLVWDLPNQTVPAENVTGYYTARRKLTVTGHGPVEVRQSGHLIAAAPSAPATFDLAAGRSYTVGGKTVEVPKGADATVAVP